MFPHHEMSASHARVALAPEGVFARVYAHAGMVSYQGEKMSKSLGNLVFVSRLLADGVDPMAIRMALLAHHYRSDWEWTDAVLGDAEARLSRWRAALARAEAVIPEAGPGRPTGLAAEAEIGGGRPSSARPAPGRPARPNRSSPACGRGCATTWTLPVRSPSSIAGRIRCCTSRRTRFTPSDVAGARLVKQTVDALLGISL